MYFSTWNDNEIESTFKKFLSMKQYFLGQPTNNTQMNVSKI